MKTTQYLNQLKILKQKLSQNNILSIIDKNDNIDLNQLFKSIESKEKCIKLIKSILNKSQFEIFSEIIDNEDINDDINDDIMDLSNFGLLQSNINKRSRSKTVCKKRKKKINIKNITSVPALNGNDANFSSLERLIKGTDSEEKTENLLKGALSAISESYKIGIDNIEKEIKIQKRIIQTGIKNIDQQIFALSQQKKQFKIEMSQFNKDGNNKIDQLLSHKIFIDKLLIKYKEAINNRYKQILSSSEWKYHLIEIIGHYSFYISDFENKILDEMLKLKEPILSPSSPLNPNKVYGIPQNQYEINARIHNKNVLSSLSYPKTMDLEKVMKLEKGTNIDYRDFNARFLKAQIMQIEIDKDKLYKKYGITYEGWDNKWNVWSIPKHQFQRYAIYGSISMRKLHRKCMQYIKLNKPYGDYLEIKPMHLFYHNMYKMEHAQDINNPININYCNQYLQWHLGQVVLSDNQSAQVQCILYKYCNKTNKWFKPTPKADVYWVHLDNFKECAPINTHFKFNI